MKIPILKLAVVLVIALFASGGFHTTHAMSQGFPGSKWEVVSQFQVSYDQSQCFDVVSEFNGAGWEIHAPYFTVSDLGSATEDITVDLNHGQYQLWGTPLVDYEPYGRTPGSSGDRIVVYAGHSVRVTSSGDCVTGLTTWRGWAKQPKQAY